MQGEEGTVAPRELYTGAGKKSQRQQNPGRACGGESSDQDEG